MQKPTTKTRTYNRSPATRRLTPADVVSIRETYAQSTATTCAGLARLYRVAPSMIHGIVVGHYYRDCGGPLVHPADVGRPVRRRGDHVEVTDEVEVTLTRDPEPAPRQRLCPGMVVRLRVSTAHMMAVDGHEDEEGRVRVTWHDLVGRACVSRVHVDNLEIVGGRPINGGGR